MRSLIFLVCFGLGAQSAWAYNESECKSCVGSYFCESYSQSCVKDCAVKVAAGEASAGPCEEACKATEAKCTQKATKDCSDYCKK